MELELELKTDLERVTVGTESATDTAFPLSLLMAQETLTALLFFQIEGLKKCTEPELFLENPPSRSSLEDGF
jgi:hypothetical protein